MHVLVSERERRQVRLEDHLILWLRLEADAEQEVVEHLAVRVRGVSRLGGAHEVKVEMSGDRCGVVDRSRNVSTKVPDHAAGARIKAGCAEGEGLWTSVQDLLQDLVVRGAVVGWVAQEEALPEANFELGPERGLVGHALRRKRVDRGHGARGGGYEGADCR